MPIGDRLFPASFNNVPFLVPRELQAGGKKVVVHEYPGSSKRFVEDLGRLEPVFSIVAVIHGLDVDQQRRTLTDALDQDGPGVFSHPYLGPLRVVCTEFSIRSADSELGEIIFDIEFTQTSDQLSIEPLTGSARTAFDAARKARAAVDRAVEDRYQPLAIADSINKLGDRVGEQLAVIQGEVSAVVTPPTDALNDVTRNIVNTRSDLLSIVRTPRKLVTAMRGVFDTMLALGETPADLRREWANLTNFGAPQRFLSNGQRSRTLGTVRAPIRRTTAQRVVEDDNLRVLDQFIRIQALINSFEAEASAAFATDIELDAVRARLAEDFERIIQDQDDVVATSFLGDEVLTDGNVTQPSEVVSEAVAFADSLGFDPDLRAALDELRVATFDVLSADVKNAFRVKTFDLGVTDIQLATYQLYGNLDNLDLLAGLNGEQNLGVIRDPVKAVVL